MDIFTRKRCLGPLFAENIVLLGCKNFLESVLTPRQRFLCHPGIISKLSLAARACTVYFRKRLFSETHRGRRNFKVFVFGHHFEPALDGELEGGYEVDGFVGAARAHVGELLAFGRIDHHLFTLGRIADDHALIDFDCGADVEDAALLQIPQRETERLACGHGYHRADLLALDFARMRFESNDARGENAFAFCIKYELAAIPEEPARGAFENEPHLRPRSGRRMTVVNLEVAHDELTGAEAFDDGTLIDGRRVNNDLFVGLQFPALFLVEDDLRL